MTITVNTPAGSSFDFPDGRTRDVITNVINRHFATASVTAPPLRRALINAVLSAGGGGSNQQFREVPLGGEI